VEEGRQVKVEKLTGGVGNINVNVRGRGRGGWGYSAVPVSVFSEGLGLGLKTTLVSYLRAPVLVEVEVGEEGWGGSGGVEVV
jgi:hypothetical protein